MDQSETIPSNSIAKLAEALAKAQAKIKAPLKNRKVDFTDKNGRRVNYSYADLADVIDCIREPLSSNGLAVVHRFGYLGDSYGLTTILLHSSGEQIDTWYPLPDPSKQQIRAQEFGSAITYARRYSLSALVGIASEEDDDGAGAAPTPPPKPAAAPKPPQAKAPAPPASGKPRPANHAPANEHLMSEIYDLAISRDIKEGELMYLVREGYGVQGPVPPAWIAHEILELLKDESVTSTKVLAHAQRTISRREAARLLNGGSPKNE